MDQHAEKHFTIQQTLHEEGLGAHGEGSEHTGNPYNKSDEVV